MSYLSENNKQYYRYFGLLAIVIVGVVSILGSGGGGGGDSAPPPPTGPSIDNVFPSPSSDTALVTTVVTAQFDRAMDKTTIDDPEKNFTVIDDLTKNDVPGSVEYFSTYEKVHNYVAVFTPNKDLDTSKSYTATVTTDVKDTSGNPLARDYIWSFFIAPSPVAVSVDESDTFGTTGINTASPSAPSATGEYVVFASTDNLANLNTGGISQIYRKNTVTKKVELVSTTSNNLTVADGPCASPRISDTGRYVVFSSTASNLDSTVTNTAGKSHIYLKDMRDGTISLLDRSITNVGEAGNGNSSMPDISGIPDTGSGKFIVFESTADDLHADDDDTISDIFLVNVTSGSVELISKSSDVNPDPNITVYLKGNDNSYRPRVSDNGNRVVFDSIATNLLDVGGDSNGKSDIFLRNLGNDTTIRLSVDANGDEVSGGTVGSTHADISADGVYVVFQSDQPTLVNDANNNITDIFVRETVDESTIEIFSLADGDADGANNDSERPSISANGRYITFESKASDLVAVDTNGVADVFVRERNSTTISLLSVDNNDTQGNLDSINAAISANGRYVSFTTNNNLDTADGNGKADIYRAYNAEFR
jgi:hypothetical protein